MTSHARSVLALVVTLTVWLGRGEPAHAYYGFGSTSYAYEFAPTFAPELRCDNCEKLVQLPFWFPYYGQNFSKVAISTNGYVYLTNEYQNGDYAGLQPGASGRYLNKVLSIDGTTNALNNFIAPLWDDWDLSVGGSVYHGMVGDHFVIEWYNVLHKGDAAGSPSYTFELKLFPSGRIEFHYRTMASGKAWDYGQSATIGYQDSSYTIGWAGSYNTSCVGNNTALGFIYPGSEALYVKSATDLFGKARPGVKFGTPFNCEGGVDRVVVTGGTDSTGRAFGASNWCSGANSYLVGGMSIPIVGSATPQSGPAARLDPESNLWMVSDTSGKPVAMPELCMDCEIKRGKYFFLRWQNLTPAPTVTKSWDIGYPATAIARHDFFAGGDGSYAMAQNGDTLPAVTKRGYLHYYQAQTATNNLVIDKPILIVTGFDPLDETSTAYYLLAMSPLVAPLMAAGYDIVLGELGDKFQPMQNMQWETMLWINDAYTRNTTSDKRIDLVGISMGGVLVRQVLTPGIFGDFGTNVKRWFSIDAPHLGANITGNKGPQGGVLHGVAQTFKDLLAGGTPAAQALAIATSNPVFRRLFSPPAMQMKRTTPASCSFVHDDPENSSCVVTTAGHDAYYDTIGWPTTTATRFAVAFGNGNMVNAKPARTKLIDFSYGGVCTDDQDWFGGKRDYIAGSTYISAAQVNDYIWSFWCDLTISMLWEPAFINVDSALNLPPANTFTASLEEQSVYPTQSSLAWNAQPYWTGGTATNDTRRRHTRLSCKLRNQLCTWISGSSTLCSTAPGCEP